MRKLSGPIHALNQACQINDCKIQVSNLINLGSIFQADVSSFEIIASTNETFLVTFTCSDVVLENTSPLC
jgi:hypothetical protein